MHGRIRIRVRFRPGIVLRLHGPRTHLVVVPVVPVVLATDRVPPRGGVSKTLIITVTVTPNITPNITVTITLLHRQRPTQPLAPPQPSPHARPKVPELHPPHQAPLPVLFPEQKRVLRLDIPVPDPDRVQVPSPLQHIPHHGPYLRLAQLPFQRIQVPPLGILGRNIQIHGRMHQLPPDQPTLPHGTRPQERRPKLQHVGMPHPPKHRQLPQDQLGLPVVVQHVGHPLQRHQRIDMALRRETIVHGQTHAAIRPVSQHPKQRVHRRVGSRRGRGRGRRSTRRRVRRQPGHTPLLQT